MDWSLHPQLAPTRFRSATCALARVLLANDANYPWLILVPRRPASSSSSISRRTRRCSCSAKSPQRARALKSSPNATSSISPRSATRCRNCMSTSSRAGAPMPPGPSRSGASNHRLPMSRKARSVSNRCGRRLKSEGLAPWTGSSGSARNPHGRAPARILIISLRRIGDLLLTTPVIRSVRRAWPEVADRRAGIRQHCGNHCRQPGHQTHHRACRSGRRLRKVWA